jgi:hypothetical protein
MNTKKSPRRGQTTKLIILKQRLDCIVSGLRSIYYGILIFFQEDFKEFLDKILDFFS